MLTKTQNNSIMQSIVKNARDIKNMFLNGEIDKAFIKYETARDILYNIELQFIFDNRIKETLLDNNIPLTKIEGFFASYCKYSKNEITISTVTL